ncbi:MAG: hypothetical protein AB7V55_06670 [Oscillospiraceae bacterium]
MTRKHAKNALAVLTMFLVLAMAAVCFAPLTASAAQPPAVVYTDEDNSGITPLPETEGVEIISYSIKQPGGVIPEQITKGTSFSLYVKIHDTRAGVTSDLNPNAHLNTSSFTTDSAHFPNVTKHKVSTGNSFTLDFPLTYTGVGNTFQCDIYYKNNNSIPLYTISLSFNQVVEYIEPDPSDSSEDPVRGTGFVLKGASFGGPSVMAGSTFNLDAQMLSTNGSYAVENVTVSAVLPKEISLSTGQSIRYVGRVGPNQEVPVTFELLASAVAEEGSYTVTLSINGVSSDDGSPVNAEMDVTIPLAQPERFEISNIQVPEYMTAGMDDGSGYGMVYLVNKGKGIIYNVTVFIEGEGLSTDMGRQFIGNINPGSEGNADFNVMASVPGQIDGKLVVEYENAKGEVKQLVHEFIATVVEGGGDMNGGGIIEPMPEPMPEESTGISLWVWIVVAAAVIIILIVVIVVVRKRKARKAEAELEDDDEDF